MPDYPAIETIPEVTSNLTAIERVKEMLDDSETNDTLLSNLIAAASGEMKRFLDREINQGTATDEKIDSIGQNKISVRHYPIISITSLEENGTALTEDTHFECLEWDKLQGAIVRISGDDTIAWAAGSRVIKVTYVHGYADVPYEIVQAVTDLVLFDYRQSAEGGGRFGLDGKVLDTGGSSGYRTRPEIWEAHLPRIAGYRRKA
jgi:hypothetical protein